LDGGQFAFRGPFDELGRNPAQRMRIAPEFNQERAVKRLFTVHAADRSSHDVLRRYYRSGETVDSRPKSILELALSRRFKEEADSETFL
jgi:hypothetical protein